MLIAIATAVLPVSPAMSHDVRFGNRVTLGLYVTDLYGRVTSAKRACVRNREVKIYRVRPGRDRLFELTYADAHGYWEQPVGIPQGRFYALIPRIDVTPRGHAGTHYCRRARSRAILLP